MTLYGDIDNPLFLAKEVAEWIEHSDVSTMIRNIDDDEKLTQTLQWLLYKKYHNKGYVHSETFTFKRSNGKEDVEMVTKWTQKGRLFLYNLLKEEEILPLIEQEEKIA